MEIIIPRSAHPVHLQKSKLVDLGLFALARGKWQVVHAITRLIQKRGWVHV
jgi:hypothetical protein